MTYTQFPSVTLYGPPGSAEDHRQKVLHETEARAALRETELQSQHSVAKDPEERIAIWERLHALSLPRSPDHALVEVIARRTRLTIDQVHEEQQRRASARVPGPNAAAEPVGSFGEGLR